MFCGGSKSAKGGPNPLADMDRGSPNPLADLDRGVQIRCDTGTTENNIRETPLYYGSLATYLFTAISIQVVGSKPQAYKTRPKGNMGF